MHYLRDGLAKRGLEGLGIPLSVLFIIFCIGGSLAGGNAFQVYQSKGILAQQISFFEDHGWAYGLIMAFAVGIVIIGGIVLAYRNLKMGRSDRKGAFRLVMFVVVGMLFGWVLHDFRLQTLNPGGLLFRLTFGQPLGHALLHALLVWVFYIAIEPYVRRLWPESMVSWTRLLMGRFRDPLVGRDVLVGMATIGTLVAVVGWGVFLVLRWSGLPPPEPSVGEIDRVLGGVRETLSFLVNSLQGAVFLSMALLVLLLLTRMVVRKTWVTVSVYVVLFTLIAVATPQNAEAPVYFRILLAIFMAMVAITFVALLLRFGLVAVIGGGYMLALLSSELWTNLSQWYSASSILVMAAILAVAGWAFYTSLAGRSLFKDSMFES